MSSSTSSGPTVPYSVIDDGDIRVVAKIFLLVIVLAIAFVGGYCVQFFIQRQLLKGKAVSLTTTTGWMHGPVLAKISWQLRRLPGGWIGLLMLLTTALELTSEFGIAKSITLISQQSRSTYSIGMIVDDTHATSLFPDTLYESYSWARAAQDYSAINRNRTGLLKSRIYGVYRFFNWNDYNFMPTADDILGYWSCNLNTPSPVVYNQSSQGNTTIIQDTSILNDLVRRGLMYNASSVRASTNISYLDLNGTSSGPSYHVTLWTASNYTFGSAPNFTFAVQRHSDQEGLVKTMEVFQCSLTSTEPRNIVQQVNQNINWAWTIDKWIRQLSGALYPNFADLDGSYTTDYLEFLLEYHLNALIMVAGSGQSTNMPNSRNYTYGTFEYATVIPYWIIAIGVVTFALLLFLIGYLIFLWFSNKRLRRSYDQQGPHQVAAKDIVDHTPVGLLGWMGQAAATSRDTSIPKEGSLSRFILSTSWHGSKRLGIVKEDEHGLMYGDAERESEDTLMKQENKG